MTVFGAAERYRAEGIPAVVVAGRNYGCGSSRDWAAKGARLLGVRAVIAESFERIHRSNLVGMGVLPLQFPDGVTRQTLGLDGHETVDIPDVAAALQPGGATPVRFTRPDGATQTVVMTSRIDTRREADWVAAGGVLPFVLEEIAAA
jgi:aconitate hydratase